MTCIWRWDSCEWVAGSGANIYSFTKKQPKIKFFIIRKEGGESPTRTLHHDVRITAFVVFCTEIGAHYFWISARGCCCSSIMRHMNHGSNFVNLSAYIIAPWYIIRLGRKKKLMISVVRSLSTVVISEFAPWLHPPSRVFFPCLIILFQFISLFCMLRWRIEENDFTFKI